VTKAELHKLVDELPDEAVDTAAEVLKRAAHHPELLAELAQWDDESVSEEEDRQVAEAREEPSLPFEDLVRDLDH